MQPRARVGKLPPHLAEVLELLLVAKGATDAPISPVNLIEPVSNNFDVVVLQPGLVKYPAHGGAGRPCLILHC